jgi:hypothetical protein
MGKIQTDYTSVNVDLAYIIDRNSRTYTYLTFSSLEDSKIVAKNIAFKLVGDPILLVMFSNTTGLFTIE